MQSTCLETTDIFRGAFLLASGGELAEIRVGGGKRIATFMITGDDLARLDRDYRCGRALVNPVQLRVALNHLRDVLFKRLRERDPASPKGYARTGPATSKDYAGTGRRTRNGDRKSGDRCHQAWG